MVTPINHNKLSMINNAFKFNLIALYNEYNFVKNCDKRKAYHTIFSNKEKLCIS